MATIKNYLFSIILGELCILAGVIVYSVSDVIEFVDLPYGDGSSLIYSPISEIVDDLIAQIAPYALIVFFVTFFFTVTNKINQWVEKKQSIRYTKSLQIYLCRKKGFNYQMICNESNQSQRGFALVTLLLFLSILFISGIILQLILGRTLEYCSLFFVMQLPVVGIFAIIEFLVRTLCKG